MTRQTCRPRSPRRRHGAAVLEMAFVLPVLILFIVGTMDLARLVYAYDVVAEAARVGARYAMVHGNQGSPAVGPTANDATVAAVVKNNVPALNSSLLTVSSSWGTGTNKAGNPVTVTASYQCPLALGHFVGFPSVTVTSSTTMTITH